jgi:hypothetical protein
LRKYNIDPWDQCYELKNGFGKKLAFFVQSTASLLKSQKIAGKNYHHIASIAVKKASMSEKKHFAY